MTVNLNKIIIFITLRIISSFSEWPTTEHAESRNTVSSAKWSTTEEVFSIYLYMRRNDKLEKIVHPRLWAKLWPLFTEADYLSEGDFSSFSSRKLVNAKAESRN